jgi:hypothetical protein
LVRSYFTLRSVRGSGAAEAPSSNSFHNFDDEREYPEQITPARLVYDGAVIARRLLLLCGIVASSLYVAMNLVVPMRWPEYSSFAQTVSELSAIDAPTRAAWAPLGVAYAVLMVAFGAGVWASSNGRLAVGVSGCLLVAYGALGTVWPPMHQRAVLAAGGHTRTDTLHLVWAAVTVLLMFLAMLFGAAALGRRFRVYSIATIVTLLAFGVLTSMQAPAVEANLPTPWIGVWERINLGAFLPWVIVLAVMLLRQRDIQMKRIAR